MKTRLQTMCLSVALMSALTAAPSFAAPTGVAFQDRDHDRDHDREQHLDYSNNRYYNMGNREGYQDYNKKQQRKEHNHKFRNDDDRRAHDYGYQQGWTGTRGYNTDSDRPH